MFNMNLLSLKIPAIFKLKLENGKGKTVKLLLPSQRFKTNKQTNLRPMGDKEKRTQLGSGRIESTPTPSP